MQIINTYHVPVPVRANAKGAAFLAVLTEGAANDQAVYIGIAGDMGDTDSDSYESVRFAAAEWVAYHGLKLPYRKALAYFPNLKAKEYRD
jgi:hypothetical protein